MPAQGAPIPPPTAPSPYPSLWEDLARYSPESLVEGTRKLPISARIQAHTGLVRASVAIRVEVALGSQHSFITHELTPRGTDFTMVEQISSTAVVASPRPPLRLPDIKPLPLPDDSELRLLSQLHGTRDDDGCAAPRNGRCAAAGFAFGGDIAPPSRPRRGIPLGARDLDDFLNDAGASRSGRGTGTGGRSWRQTMRPSQRRAIDDDTMVPAEVFDEMMRLGGEARARASHTLEFALPEGKPYLRRRGEVTATAPSVVAADSGLVAAKVASQSEGEVAEHGATAPPKVVVPAPARPPSACASEAMEAWRHNSPSPVPVQVL